MKRKRVIYRDLFEILSGDRWDSFQPACKEQSSRFLGPTACAAAFFTFHYTAYTAKPL